MSLYVGDRCSEHVENWNRQIYEKELWVKLASYKDRNKMHGQQNIKFCFLELNSSLLIVQWESYTLCFLPSLVLDILDFIFLSFSLRNFYHYPPSSFL